MNRIILIFCFLWCFSANAEFICNADIRYKWRLNKTIQDIDKSNKKDAKTNTEAEEKEKSDANIRDVFWATAESKADTEELAKANLKSVINDKRAQADLHCREQHENQAGCLSNKFAQNAGLQATLTYSQRKELEKKVIEDCESNAGSCLGSASTEPTCREVVVAKTEEEPATKDKAKEKDAKKK